jgi:GNAT superfamily N-acetyltransferase
MAFTIQQTDETGIGIIQDLIRRIWYPTYENILTEEQSNYMLDEMYSSDILLAQMQQQEQIFLLVYEDEHPVGFAAFEYNYNAGTVCKLHKIYLLPTMQGKGVGKLLLQEVAMYAATSGQKTLLLNVNRFNNAINFYKRQGFHVIAEEDIDIGNGYFMNDYLMEKHLV